MGSGHWINDVRGGGAIVELEDGSIWQVDPIDRIDSSLWLVVDDIVVSETGTTASYPYMLINTSENEAVDARYLGG